MPVKINNFILLFSLVLFACDTTKNIENINYIPTTVKADEQYANVFQPLDGTWEGIFKIYEDQARSKHDKNDLKDLDVNHLRRPSLKLSSAVQVKQVYESKSPYFQEVEIEDTYTDKNGEIQIIKSNGVNKIQDGKMWCVVKKPSETVIHRGSLDEKQTIIWQRNEKKPQKIEYFKETVQDHIYEIIGYGYYAGDDTKLSPKYWFYGRYKRQ